MSENGATLTVEVPRRAMQLASDKLPPGVVLLMVAPQDLAPEFIRLPDGEDRCPVTGMSRTWIMDRVRLSRGTKYAIRTHHVREKGRTRGTVLIDRQSLIDYVRAFAEPDWAHGGEDAGDETQIGGHADA